MIAGMPSVTVISRCTGRPCWSKSSKAAPPVPAGTSNSPAWIGSLEAWAEPAKGRAFLDHDGRRLAGAAAEPQQPGDEQAAQDQGA